MLVIPLLCWRLSSGMSMLLCFDGVVGRVDTELGSSL
jgi:hypothetical protein